MSKKKSRKDSSFRSRNKPEQKLGKDIVGLAQWRAYVLESEKPVVVDFWATWCAPCRLMTPILEEVATAYEGSVRFAKVNTQSNNQIAQGLNIRSIPTLIIFYRGEVFDVNVGLTPAHRLHKMVRRVLDKHQGVGFIEKFKRWWRRTEGKNAEPENPKEVQ